MILAFIGAQKVEDRSGRSYRPTPCVAGHVPTGGTGGARRCENINRSETVPGHALLADDGTPVRVHGGAGLAGLAPTAVLGSKGSRD